MRIALPYLDRVLEADLSWGRPLPPLDISEAPPLDDVDAALYAALEDPLGQDAPLRETLPDQGEVLILVSDSFRQTRADRFLSPLIRYLEENGVSGDRIAFLFATGTHRPPTEDERRAILGEAVYARFRDRVYDHDPRNPADLVHTGTTSRGTPVYLNRRACEAAAVIVTGTVVFHYFGGFGGGRKSILPGIAGEATIAANHALNLDPIADRLNPDVAIGRTRGNPVAEDMLEGSQFRRDLFLINTVLNRNGQITGLFAGDLAAAHGAACDLARSLHGAPLRERADLVIASAGGAKNFVQSHKALYNAWQALNPGGVIILAAPAPEGLGGNRFAEWLALGTRDRIIAALRARAEINGQTALSTVEKAKNTLFLTEMTDADVRMLGGRKATSLEDALAEARRRLAANGVTAPACILMPSAGYTVPIEAGATPEK